jgi:hypothetical protein
MISKDIRVFTDNRIKLTTTSGGLYETISLTVHEYLPANQDLLVFHTVKRDPGTQMHTTESSPAPPLALYEQDFDGLREKLSSNMNSISQNIRNTSEATFGLMSEMTLEVINAIYRYGTASEVSLKLYEGSG